MVTTGKRITRKACEQFVRFSRLIVVGFGIGVFLLSPQSVTDVKAAPIHAAKPLPPPPMTTRQPLPIPSLQTLVAGTETQQAALTAVVDYYTTHQAELALMFDEDDDTRLKALYGMYLIHNAVPYGVVRRLPTTLAQFLALPRVDCGVYTIAQGWLYTALGLRWRKIVVDREWHDIDEVWFGDHWETFDSTSNMWLSVSVHDLMEGVARMSRTYYTPVTDAKAPQLFRLHRFGGWDVLGIRNTLPNWGYTVFPHHWYVAPVGAEVVQSFEDA